MKTFGALCTFSLLGQKGEGVVFSRPLGALRAWRESSEASFARRSRMARFTSLSVYVALTYIPVGDSADRVCDEERPEGFLGG